MKAMITFICILFISGCYFRSENPFDCSSLVEIMVDIDKYYEREKIFHTGLEVLEEAKNLELNSVSLLGRYFNNNERGFPKNKKLGFCLEYRSYESGYVFNAWQVAEKLEELKNFKKAISVYSEYLGYAQIRESWDLKKGVYDPYNFYDYNALTSPKAFHKIISIIEKNNFDKEEVFILVKTGYETGIQKYNILK